MQSQNYARYIVYGLGISGISAIKYLCQNNRVIATDDNESSINKAKEILKHNVDFITSSEINFTKDDIIICSPGIEISFPKPHKTLSLAKKAGAKIICDIEEFYSQNIDNNFIGITGTNAKSTVTTLIGEIFKHLNIKSHIGGNIGVPCFDLEKNQKNFTYIFETSSYQLDLIDKTRYKIACLLNITPDHIDHHGSFKNYVSAKKRIFKNQQEGDFAIINFDDENCKQIYEELKADKNYKATLIKISKEDLDTNSIQISGNKVICKIANSNNEFNLEPKYLLGSHNIENIAFCLGIITSFAIQNNLKLDINKIIQTINNFKGLKHRMEILGEISGINFINDSKATNQESSAKALDSFNNIFWILGGKSKENGIQNLQPFFHKIQKAYLIGESTDEFAKFLEKNAVIFEKCSNLENAFKKAFLDAKNSDLKNKNILLSPSCASFDQWKNFEERGSYFCKLFNELSKT